MAVVDSEILIHVGFVVNDIEETAKKFSEFLGLPIPKFGGGGDFAVTQTNFKGEPAPNANIRSAFFSLGENCKIELIEPNHEPSTWREHLDTHGEGFHHLAFKINDMEMSIKNCENFGMEFLQRGNYGNGNGRYTYMDGSKDLKCVIELLENFKK